MRIHGLQKMTLLDFPGRVACTVFLGGCDFRCPFCHNFGLVDGSAPPLMGEEELLSFLKRRRGLLDGVAITGGEPCLHPELPRLMRSFRDLGYAVKLDTNGNHPAMLAEILRDGLADYLAMDIKNSPEKYAMTVGLPELDLAPVRESAALLMGSGIPFEFRTTVVRELHRPEDFHGIGQMIAGAETYFLQAFTDRETVPFGNLHPPTAEEMQLCASVAAEYVKQVTIRGMDI